MKAPGIYELRLYMKMCALWCCVVLEQAASTINTNIYTIDVAFWYL